MVKGLDVFGKYFSEFKDQYVIIGGAACDTHIQSAELTPRATKDIDMILIIEALSSEFVKRFWDFIVDGKYERKENGEERNYYRFVKPANTEFPVQVELFARNPDLLDLDERVHLTPVPTPDDLSSLSAILLDDTYYHFVSDHSEIVDGIHWASIEALICLKAKAFIDISRRIQEGSKEDKKLLRKHKGDVFRLGILLAESQVYMLPAQLFEDMAFFLDLIKDDLPNKAMFKDMGVVVAPTNVFYQIKSSLLPEEK
jgi:hypothetical protein